MRLLSLASVCMITMPLMLHSQQWVDGSTHPEAVAHSTAYIFLFQSLLPGKNESIGAYNQRSKAYTSNLMKFTDEEATVVLQAARQFQGLLDGFAQRKSMLLPQGAPVDAAIKLQFQTLQREFEGSVMTIAGSLESALKTEGRERLEAHLLYVKRHSRVLK
jgi:hypothetical protein